MTKWCRFRKRKDRRIEWGKRFPLGSPNPLSPPTILKGWTFKIKGGSKVIRPSQSSYRALSDCFHLWRLTSENPAWFRLISIAQYSVADDPIKLWMMNLARVKRNHDWNNRKRNTDEAEIAECLCLLRMEWRSRKSFKISSLPVLCSAGGYLEKYHFAALGWQQKDSCLRILSLDRLEQILDKAIPKFCRGILGVHLELIDPQSEKCSNFISTLSLRRST